MDLIQKIIDIIKEKTGATSDALAWAMLVVGALIIVFALIGIVISIYLWIKYHNLNKTKNSCGLTGEEAARKILDNNGLQNIRVSATGSFIFGNSYSHVFKKVRLRRFTYKKDSITSLAMAAEKSALAVMDKEHDPVMKARNVLIPLQILGPFMFLPLVIIGVAIDLAIAYLQKTNPSFIPTLICAGSGVLLYVVSFVLTIVILKAETKAQAKSLEILKKENMANQKELELIKDLYKAYNLEYVNNMIISFLELVLRVLQIVAALQGGASKSSNN